MKNQLSLKATVSNFGMRGAPINMVLLCWRGAGLAPWSIDATGVEPRLSRTPPRSS